MRAGLVAHPSKYLWFSYRHTALGQANELLSVHDEYRRLGKTNEERQAAYRLLFKTRIAQQTAEKIRRPTKAWGRAMIGSNAGSRANYSGRLRRRPARVIASRKTIVITQKSIDPDLSPSLFGFERIAPAQARKASEVAVVGAEHALVLDRESG